MDPNGLTGETRLTFFSREAHHSGLTIDSFWPTRLARAEEFHTAIHLACTTAIFSSCFLWLITQLASSYALDAALQEPIPVRDL